ncbi:MAG: hypothetical protein KME60_28005 [Cyanomargarita calcarea GSE-NOS-MK-12-04C]|jgi:hypothetical protein|uniref:Uncharacterized protein n=1 Tax=Cyanomargarita calcarea GSE-NOS-MK-12-04C TaxID=2839659 RepID=A0A951QSF2_9CYAN|nr:hypothetical protein [Cyanomargarita calcarea GSE-NOS-MK-12-04C]
MECNRKNYDFSKSIHELLELQVEKTPDAIASLKLVVSRQRKIHDNFHGYRWRIKGDTPPPEIEIPPSP